MNYLILMNVFISVHIFSSFILNIFFLLISMTFPDLEFLDILILSIAIGTLFEAPTLSAIAQCLGFNCFCFRAHILH